MWFRIVILNKGNVEQFSTPNEIYEDPNNIFVAEFIGSPKMNIIRLDKKKINSDSIYLFNNHIKLEGYNLEDVSFLGIRPEHIVIGDEYNIKFEIKVDLIENLGFEKIIYASAENQELRIKTTEKNVTNLKKVSFSSNNIYIFDKDGNRIRKNN